jgi:hypothetical protein
MRRHILPVLIVVSFVFVCVVGNMTEGGSENKERSVRQTSVRETTLFNNLALKFGEKEAGRLMELDYFPTMDENHLPDGVQLFASDDLSQAWKVHIKNNCLTFELLYNYNWMKK